MLKEFIEMLVMWLPTTWVAALMWTKWGWPIAESLHFIGLSLLIGAVGLFDLRLIGLGKHISVGALHRLVPWGVLGFAINVITGLCFFTAAPDQYTYNPSFQLKMLFIWLAGINVMLFYTTMFRKTKALGPGEHAPLPARIIGGASLFLWLGVMIFGRMLTFFRPPSYWCPWC